ncbi:biotin-(acetyl-carboxylase) ligase [Cryptosporidium ubiquitum]|uniref:Biotin-(Acetyl-carboxylase) ligase n=1 Tax=Cryptosporidium ubiquitum TaxID=857276 RepID=A0A1J4MFQ3_9CRYT|nr:biotin-(acetyl-carboxylase) ligase [Cryptosporidium ubiquitum]OII71860.1 biotin-(acetyl-carboxylase) ligase [Cryptosporidium ubiquitum]
MSDQIDKIYRHKEIPLNVCHFTTLPSTQTWAYDNIDVLVSSEKLSPKVWTVITADNMTSGIGSYDHKTLKSRVWCTSHGKNLNATYITLRRRNFSEESDKHILNLSLYTLGIALTVCKILGEFGIKEPKIKWVNDIYVNGKKLGGILSKQLEKRYVFEHAEYEPVVFGIGLNVLHDECDLPKNVETPATSVKLESALDSSFIQVNNILERLHLEVIKSVTNINSSVYVGFQDTILTEINKRLLYKGNVVRILDYEEEGNEMEMGIFQGVDKNGFAIIKSSKVNGCELKLSHGRIKFDG